MVCLCLCVISPENHASEAQGVMENEGGYQNHCGHEFQGPIDLGSNSESVSY